MCLSISSFYSKLTKIKREIVSRDRRGKDSEEIRKKKNVNAGEGRRHLYLILRWVDKQQVFDVRNKHQH